MANEKAGDIAIHVRAHMSSQKVQASNCSGAHSRGQEEKSKEVAINHDSLTKSSHNMSLNTYNLESSMERSMRRRDL